MAGLQYCKGILEIIQQINDTQAEKIDQAAKWCADAIASIR